MATCQLYTQGVYCELAVMFTIKISILIYVFLFQPIHGINLHAVRFTTSKSLEMAGLARYVAQNRDR